MASSRPPPLACRLDTIPHSAHNARPYDAFSTLHPVTIRPSSTTAAAPTGYREYGAYARGTMARASSRSRSQSTLTSRRLLLVGMPTAMEAHRPGRVTPRAADDRLLPTALWRVR